MPQGNSAARRWLGGEDFLQVVEDYLDSASSSEDEEVARLQPGCFSCGHRIRKGHWFRRWNNDRYRRAIHPNYVIPFPQHTYVCVGVVYGLPCTHCGSRAIRREDKVRVAFTSRREARRAWRAPRG